MHQLRIVTLDHMRRPSIAFEKILQLLWCDAGQQRGIGDLVSVQMKDRQNSAVANRVQKFIGVPGSRQRPGLCLAISDDHTHDQVGIVERRSKRMRDAVAQFAAFIYILYVHTYIYIYIYIYIYMCVNVSVCWRVFVCCLIVCVCGV